jgi:hypothetical protein
MFKRRRVIAYGKEWPCTQDWRNLKNFRRISTWFSDHHFGLSSGSLHAKTHHVVHYRRISQEKPV